ncbi:hypothetical protein [Streptomyces candidus]|uniref:Uncharacterized protein n=1 Tax=Streptomyces candidus TaxID=67283 RepID=A0A7X0LRX8_9ACTN|nr:hypothetical protein [Streptomyces candidus]MBB6439108.1 hypothetical protein [Streptomyces candidus]GHH55676.1 hypothetical protein GCM10018773_60500 [Streptomyces candidus]
MTTLFHWRKSGWLDDIGDPDFSAYVHVADRSAGTAPFSLHTRPRSAVWAALLSDLGGPWIAEYSQNGPWCRQEADGSYEPAEELTLASESLIELWRLRFPDASDAAREPNPQFLALNDDYGQDIRSGILATPEDAEVLFRVPQYRHAPGNHMRPFTAAAARCDQAEIRMGNDLALVRSLVGNELVGLSVMMRESG